MTLSHVLSRAHLYSRVLDAGCSDVDLNISFAVVTRSKIDSARVRLIEANAFYRVFLQLLGYAWVTLATNDAYSLGALVLAHSLRRVGTKYELACLVTPGVTATMRYPCSSSVHRLPEGNTQHTA